MLRRLIIPLLLLAATPALADSLSIPPSPQVQFHPGYIVGNYYSSARNQTGGTGAVVVANTAACEPFTAAAVFTVDVLSVFLSTSDNGGNIQLAMYANGSWARPGVLLAATANIALTASTGTYSGTLTANQQIGPGTPNGSLVWLCFNSDNAVAVAASLLDPPTNAGGTLGSATQGNVVANANSITSISIAETFSVGTPNWPAFTSGTVWSDVHANTTPIITVHVASVP